MLKSYLLIAIRNLWNKKLYAGLNIFGLAVGIAGCLVIYTYIQNELSYDSFHEKADRIVKVNISLKLNDENKLVGVAPDILLPEFTLEFPEVETGVRVFNPTLYDKMIVKYQDKLFKEDKFWLADSTFFEVFSFSLVKGNPQNALNEPNKMVITENTARKYFGKEDPMGQTMLINDGELFEVTGVLENLPSNTVFDFDFLASLSSRQLQEVWEGANYFDFFVLKDGVKIETLQAKLPDLVQRKAPKMMQDMDLSLHLIPLKDIHLHSKAEFEMAPIGNPQYILIFGIIAVFILLIACVNYMNLSTASSSDRSREIGLRKALGAFNSQIFKQFISESFLLTFAGLLLALGLVELIFPFVEDITGYSLSFSLANGFNWLLLILSGLIITFLAGAYPALVLSSLKPINTLKGKLTDNRTTRSLRKALVVFQFGISIFLIIGTLIVYFQLNYLQDKHLGFEKDQVLIMSYQTGQSQQNMHKTLLSEFRGHPDIVSTSFTSALPGSNSGGQYMRAEGMPEDQMQLIWEWRVSQDFINSMGFKLVAGRNYDVLMDPDREEKYFILNETAVNQLNWSPDEAIGRKLLVSRFEGECIGVVQDFHMASMKEQIEPLVMTLSHNQVRHFIVKARTQHMEEVVNFARSTWKKLLPDQPFDYTFLDQRFAQLYSYEKNTSRIFIGFALMAVVIACLGLFGLLSFSTTKRSKEIGVRKVLGSSEFKIMNLLIRETLGLIFVALLIAAPLAYWIMDQWLEDFVYRINIHPGIYFIAFLIITLVATLTVSYHAIKAAKTNPVDVLKCE
ncbi:MAG: FtsX-like permease family protein [Candidatus Cyclobacteriaceae bacterium M3_2C_046]